MKKMSAKSIKIYPGHQYLQLLELVVGQEYCYKEDSYIREVILMDFKFNS